MIAHAYSILSFDCVTLGKKNDISLVMLRNPHGAQISSKVSAIHLYYLSKYLTEWNGAFSDSDPIWRTNPEIAMRLNYSPANDGIFWMPFNEFARIFCRILVLPKSMSAPRELCISEKLKQKSYDGKLLLGVALSRVASPSNVDALAKMSIPPYDPYLNVPHWIARKPALLAKWKREKGSEEGFLE